MGASAYNYFRILNCNSYEPFNTSTNWMLRKLMYMWVSANLKTKNSYAHSRIWDLSAAHASKLLLNSHVYSAFQHLKLLKALYRFINSNTRHCTSVFAVFFSYFCTLFVSRCQAFKICSRDIQIIPSKMLHEDSDHISRSRSVNNVKRL